MPNPQGPKPGDLPEQPLKIFTIEPACRDFLDSRAQHAVAEFVSTTTLDLESQAAFDFATVVMSGFEAKDMQPVNFGESSAGAHVILKPSASGVRLEINRTNGDGPSYDLKDIPVILLTQPEGADHELINIGYFKGNSAEVPGVNSPYSIVLSKCWGRDAVVTKESPGAKSSSQRLDQLTSEDGNLHVNVNRRRPGEIELTFAAVPQAHDPSHPANPVIEEGSLVYFAFVHKDGRKLLPAKGGKVGGVVELTPEGMVLTGTSATFRNIPDDAQLLFMLKP